MHLKKSIREFRKMLTECGGDISRLSKRLRNKYKFEQALMGELLGLKRNAVIRLENGAYKNPEKLIQSLLYVYVIYACKDVTLLEDIIALKSCVLKQNKASLKIEKENSDSFRDFAKMLDESKGSIAGLAKEIRNKYRLTQGGLAELLGVHRTAVSQLEGNKYEHPEKILADLYFAYLMLNDEGVKEDIFFLRQEKFKKPVTAKKEKEPKTSEKKQRGRRLKEPKTGLEIAERLDGKLPSAMNTYSKKTLVEIGADANQFEVMFRHVKLSYKNYRDTDYNENLNKESWNRILSFKDNERFFAALANYLLEWNNKKDGKKLVPVLKDVPNYYFKYVIPKCYFNRAAQPNQILTDGTIIKWEEMWGKHQAENPFYEVEQQTASHMQVLPTPEEKENLKKYGYKTMERLRGEMQITYDDAEYDKLDAILTQWEKDLQIKEEQKINADRKKLVKQKLLEENETKSANLVQFTHVKNAYKECNKVKELAERFYGLVTLPMIEMWLSWNFDWDKFQKWKPTDFDIYNLYKGYEPKFRSDSYAFLMVHRKKPALDVGEKDKTLDTLLDEWFYIHDTDEDISE